MQNTNAMDIYFTEKYGELCQLIDNGISEVFEYSCKHGKIRSLYIKRMIGMPFLTERYYDITTPYGYGGPVVLEASDKKKLVSSFRDAFSQYCIDNKIVSEFVRFHPLVCNHLDFNEMYYTNFNRKTVVLNLEDDKIFNEQISAKCRNMIRKSEKLGVHVEVDEALSTMDTFCKLYYMTMEKNSAADSYYFPKEYFDFIKAEFRGQAMIYNAFLEEKIIASTIILCYGENMHYHLAATDPQYYAYAAGNLLLWSAIQNGQNKCMKQFHLGGGTSSNEADRLLHFKKSFGRQESNLAEFYIGKRIYIEEVYNQLTEQHLASKNSIANMDFFPGYRA